MFCASRKSLNILTKNVFLRSHMQGVTQTEVFWSAKNSAKNDQKDGLAPLRTRRLVGGKSIPKFWKIAGPHHDNP